MVSPVLSLGHAPSALKVLGNIYGCWMSLYNDGVVENSEQGTFYSSSFKFEHTSNSNSSLNIRTFNSSSSLNIHQTLKVVALSLGQGITMELFFVRFTTLEVLAFLSVDEGTFFSKILSVFFLQCPLIYTYPNPTTFTTHCNSFTSTVFTTQQ